MATIIKDGEPTIVERRDDTSGWVVAVIVLVLVIIAGGIAWAHYHRGTAPAQTPSSSTNINVTLPGGTNNTGGSNTNPAPQQ